MNLNKNTSRLLGTTFLIVLTLSFVSGQLVDSLGLTIEGLPDNIEDVSKNNRFIKQ